MGVNTVDRGKTKKQLMDELSEMRQRVAELEASKAQWGQTREELRQRKEQLNSLYVIATAVNQSLDLKEILDAALNEVLAVMSNTGGIIYLLDETSQTYLPSAHHGITQNMLQEVTGFRSGEGFSGQVADSSEALIVPNIKLDSRNISPASVQEGWRSYAGVPIKSKKEILGVMVLLSRQENYFKLEDLDLLNHIGSHIGVAVEHARIYEQTRQAEVSLRQSEQRFHQMAAAIQAIFWMYSSDMSKLIYVSPACEKIFGHPCESLYQKPDLWKDFIHPEDRERVMSYSKEHDGADFDIEYRIIRADGSIRWIDSHVFPIRDEPGKMEYIAGLSEDISERKYAEEQIRLHSEELEELVEERTLRIQELERQRREIEKLIVTGRMAARIAHEINNPLAGIRNSFLLVKDAIPADHPYYEYVARIDKEISRIAWIVRQMFDLYRPDQYLAHEYRVGGIISDIVTMLDHSCRQHGVSIEIDSTEESSNVIIRDILLRQVLYNIIQNGIEASPPGGIVRISVTLNENVLIFRISDEGVGIPEEVRFRIFDSFFSTKSDTANGGLGLGLSVSKSLMEAMEGSIDFESQVGSGTTFIIQFPLDGKKLE